MSDVAREPHFRKAKISEKIVIWQILQQAIERRKNEGSRQWQDGYPNLETIEDDIQKGFGYVLIKDNIVTAYAALIFEVEPAYEIIEGKWLSNGPYAVVHRVAVANQFASKGFATQVFKEIEKVVLSKNIYSIKVDTNFDNAALLKIVDKLGYTYCGEVYFRGSARKAFEKILV